MQEHCLNSAQQKSLRNKAKEIGKLFEGGPLDPGQGKAAAGVSILGIEGLNVYPIAKPLKDYHDAVATGRCAMYCMDMGGVTLVIAVVYGWGGGGPKKGRRKLGGITDDIPTIIQMHFDALPQGPKLIAGDLNGTPRHSRPLVLSPLKMDGPMFEW